MDDNEKQKIHIHKYTDKPPKPPERDIITGVGLTALFGLFMVESGEFFFMIPMIFAGIMPLTRGISRYLKKRRLSKNAIQNEEKETSGNAEKKILQAARDANGIITPAIVTLKTGITMEKAEQLLEDMVKKGYATMQITKQGRVKYEFAEFRPEALEDTLDEDL